MIAIIDYQSGTPRSVANALATLNIKSKITSNPAVINKADRIIFPGQGRAGQAMTVLKKLNLIDSLRQTNKPFLGICIGMQLLLESSQEDNTPCLNLIPGRCQKFDNTAPATPFTTTPTPSSPPQKIPQIGWNKINITKPDPILENLPTNSYFYFINSYFVPVSPKHTIATSTYYQSFASIIKNQNFYGTQFHPERSGPAGLQLLKNFTLLTTSS